MAAPVAEFVEVAKTFGSALRPRRTVEALRGVSLRVEAGEVLGLLGPNRAGKTTLVKILLGLCRPTKGQVTRLGRPLGDQTTLARVGYMHDNQAFPRYLTATALLHFDGGLAGVAPRTLAERVPALLRRVGLEDRADEPISRYSKGMVQRLALAQALISEPELLVLDEPQEGLDIGGRTLLQEMVAAQRQAGRTTILVSHALGEVAEMCDRLAVLVEGRLAHCGPLAALLHDPQTGQRRSLAAALAPIYHA